MTRTAASRVAIFAGLLALGACNAILGISVRDPLSDDGGSDGASDGTLGDSPGEALDDASPATPEAGGDASDAGTKPDAPHDAGSAEAEADADAALACDGACNAPPTACYQPTGTCSGGTCEYTQRAAGTNCNAGTAGTCDDAGHCLTCAGGCSAPPVCQTTPGSCIGGSCTYGSANGGSTCPGGTCDGNGHCDQ